ncbi:ATP-dependent helicase HrpB [Actinokineospora sp. NBRC 105648]|uniref:ATP-dependent helicase HrpB n=1 Tax=Actinokineospora sp. NBRC 105648 TaxID=3032206 RepID=UPI0024A2259C|nr:ATP-dependent helicase HrpB [Actinokineospora sp. NBRC 105648]GLZ41616.1 ATP-dependent helicase [Actinokineospora sp. NBRC 105648]
MIALAQLPDLPVRAALGEITRTVDAAGVAVLVAPPGTGKTTLVPLALADAGKVVVAEPRRLAARAAAARMAALLGEPVGRTVGYAVRGDRKTSKDTRIEVVTSGLLVRRLQNDPELSGVDTVLLDECHERHLDADLLLALLLDARDGLRPDLRLLATSATVAEGRLAELLGGAPVIRVAARTFPVEMRYLAPLRGERIEQCAARAVRAAVSELDGDVLVFLPGAAEIRRVTEALRSIDADVLPLHGRLSTADQDAALTPGPRRRVVLSTAVAESSLTVPGVRIVIDAGQSRVARVDHRRGLSGLATVRVSAAVADQRAGRAGREAPGWVYRCWPEHEHATLPRYPEPEIRTADLTRLALELACWGTPDGTGLRWWDPPPAGPLAVGRETLTALGALADGKVTARGTAMARLGLHPRLARALLDGAAKLGADNAAEVVAILDDDGLAGSTDLDSSLRALRNGSPSTTRWRRETRRLAALVEGPRGKTNDPALVTALAHPERLARRRSASTPVYLMAGGTAVELPPGSGLGDPEWLAVAVADRPPGAAHGRVRLAARADEQLAIAAAPALLVTEEQVAWVDGDVVARRVRRLGAIVLHERALPNPPGDAVRAAVLDGLRKSGLELVRFSAAAQSLRERLDLLHRTLGDPWPAVDDNALLANAESWIGNARDRASLSRLDMTNALRVLLPWPAATRLEELVPERVEVPSGSKVRLDYSGDSPALPVKVQEVFGWTSSPTVIDGRVPVVLHLLSPAGRPVAVTGDLASFWASGYRQVRSELRGRYPKHRWPEDPMAAPPTRHSIQRRS